MASLRDVFNHIGRPFTLRRDGVVVAQGLGTVKGSLALVEPKAEPLAGDLLEWEGARLRVVATSAELVHGRLDHYRVEVVPA